MRALSRAAAAKGEENARAMRNGRRRENAPPAPLHAGHGWSPPTPAHTREATIVADAEYRHTATREVAWPVAPATVRQSHPETACRCIAISRAYATITISPGKKPLYMTNNSLSAAWRKRGRGWKK